MLFPLFYLATVKIKDKRVVKRKLDPKYYGVYKILKHDELNNYILTDVKGEIMDGKYTLQDLKIIPNKKNEDELFIVKKILDHKSDGVKRLYLVQWEGLGGKYLAFILFSNCSVC